MKTINISGLIRYAMFLTLVLSSYFSYVQTISNNVRSAEQVPKTLEESLKNLPPNQGACADMFKVANVTVQVIDLYGSSVSGAKVKFFSEDWFVRYPDFGWPDPWFFTADSNGRVSLKLIVGNWTIFAGGGANYKSPGHGFFAVLRTNISKDCLLTIKPDNTIKINFRDINGRVLDGEIRAMASEYIPLMAMPPVGVTSGGQIIIQVTGNMDYGVSLIKVPTLTAEGYVAFENHVKVGQIVDVNITGDSYGKITLRFLDAGLKGIIGGLDLIHYGISIDGWTVSLSLNDGATFFIKPGKIWASLKIYHQGWGYHFFGNEYEIEGGSQITLSVGGPFSAKIRTMQYEWGWTGSGSARPQIWLLIKDSFGNILYWYHDPSWKSDANISLLRNDVVIYNERFVWPFLHDGTDGDFIMIRISDAFFSDDSLDYKLELALGPFGNFDLNGPLLSNETLLPFITITTPHFNVKAPAEFPEKFSKVANWLENAYRNMSQLMDEELSSKITADFQIRWGFFGGSNALWFNIADVLMDHYSPSDTINSQLAKGGGLLHELGHVFQFSRSNLLSKDNYYNPWWFGEPFASMMAAETLGSLLDQASRKFAFGDRNRMFFDYLTGAPFSLDPIGRVPTSQHVIYHYLEKRFGIAIHQNMIREWSNSGIGSKRNILKDASFNQNETYIILYSHLAAENLAWLYQIGGIDVSEERVAQGLILLAPLPTVSFEYNPEISWVNESVAFNATASYSPNGNIISYEWDFGDGNITTVMEPTINHTYTKEGKHTVTLKVTDEKGLRNSIQKAITITFRTDLNKDEKVNIEDIFIIAKAWQSKVGDTNWNPIADVNGDGWINIYDVFLIAKDYGKTT